MLRVSAAGVWLLAVGLHQAKFTLPEPAVPGAATVMKPRGFGTSAMSVTHTYKAEGICHRTTRQLIVAALGVMEPAVGLQ